MAVAVADCISIVRIGHVSFVGWPDLEGVGSILDEAKNILSLVLKGLGRQAMHLGQKASIASTHLKC